MSLSRLAQKSLRSLRFWSTVYRQPTAGAGRPRGKTRETGTPASPVTLRFSCSSCSSCHPLCSRVSFLIPAPRAHKKISSAVYTMQEKNADNEMNARHTRKRAPLSCWQKIPSILCAFIPHPARLRASPKDSPASIYFRHFFRMSKTNSFRLPYWHYYRYRQHQLRV